jgi:hypothetical protein
MNFDIKKKISTINLRTLMLFILLDDPSLYIVKVFFNVICFVVVVVYALHEVLKDIENRTFFQLVYILLSVEINVNN